MNKPKSLSVKDFLIRKMSVKINIPEKNIEAVVNHQFQSAAIAMLTNKSIEFSGFGKYLFNTKKAIKKFEKLTSQEKVFTSISEDETRTPLRRKTALDKLKYTKADIEILKPKIQ